MNYLAHAVLSFDDKYLLLGNLIADSIKGKVAFDKVDTRVQQGILLHRHIDTFTDNHETVNEVNRILHPYLHHYAPVISDIYFDYFIHKYWSDFSPKKNYIDFTNEVYSTLKENQSHLPQKLEWMIKHYWMKSYTSIEGIEFVCAKLTSRVAGKLDFSDCGKILKKHESEIDKLFLLFFPELIETCKTWIENKKNINLEMNNIQL